MLYSETAEQSVIGGLLCDAYRLPDVLDLITHNDFYFDQHAIIFKCFEDLSSQGKPVDVVTVVSELGSNIENAGGLAYLAELAEQTPSTANIMAYTKTVKERKRERDVMHIANQMREIMLSDDEDKVNNALSLVNQIDSDSEEETTNQAFGRLIKRIEERSKNPGGVQGLSTGFSCLDRRLNGLNPQSLLIIAARPAMGKTTLALNIVDSVVNLNKKAIVFSMEMSRDELLEKLVSSRGIPLRSIKTGHFADGDWAVFNKVLRHYKDKPLVVDDRPALTIQQVRHRCIRENRKQKVELVVVDYLQLMSANGKQSREQEISAISRGLKCLAKELDCPVIALSQLNRGLENRENKRPVMSDLRESGAIEQDADAVLALYRDEVYYEGKNPGVAEVITLKHRHGEIGTDRLRSELHYSRFVE